MKTTVFEIEVFPILNSMLYFLLHIHNDLTTIVTHYLMTGKHSEKCVVR